MNLDRHLLPKMDALLCALGSVIMLSLLVFYFPSSRDSEYTNSENTFEGLFVAVEHVPKPNQGKDAPSPPAFGFTVNGTKQTEAASEDEWVHSAPGKAVMIKRTVEAFPRIAIDCNAQSSPLSCKVTVCYLGKVAVYFPEHTLIDASVPFLIPQPGQ